MKILTATICAACFVLQISGQTFDQDLQPHQIKEMDRYIKIRLLAIIKSKINDTMAMYERLISECETNINQTVNTCSVCASKACAPSSVLQAVDAGGQRLLQDVGKDTENFFVSLQQSFKLGKMKTKKINQSPNAIQDFQTIRNADGSSNLGTRIYKAADSVKLSLASGFNTLEKGLKSTKGAFRSVGKRSIRNRRFAQCVTTCGSCQRINSKVKKTKAIIDDVCGAMNSQGKQNAKNELIKMSELYNAAKGNTVLISKVTYVFDVKKMMLGDTSFVGKKIVANLHGTIRTLPTTLVIRPFNLRGTAVALAQEVYNKW